MRREGFLREGKYAKNLRNNETKKRERPEKT